MTWSRDAVEWEARVIRAAVNDHEDLDSRLHVALTGFLAEANPRLLGEVVTGLAIFGSYVVRRLANELGVAPDELIDEYVQRREGNGPT